MRKKIKIIFMLAAALILTACGNKKSEETKAADVPLADLKAAVVKAVGETNYFPNMEFDETMLNDIYGISSDLYTEILAEGPMISTNVDTLIVMKTSGEEQAEQAEQELNAYREMLVSDTMQYPMNIGKIQASKVERIGNYVLFVQLGGEIPLETMDAGEEASAKYCEGENEKAITAVKEVLGVK